MKTRQTLIAAITSLAAVAAAAAPAMAGPTCGERTDIVRKLSHDFKEAPQSVGMVNNQAVIEVFVSEKGSWTIIASGTDGKSCVLSAGDGWQTDALAGLPGA